MISLILLAIMFITLRTHKVETPERARTIYVQPKTITLYPAPRHPRPHIIHTRKEVNRREEFVRWKEGIDEYQRIRRKLKISA